jgi:hypothetical protein
MFSLTEFVREVHFRTAETDPEKLMTSVITELQNVPEQDRDTVLEQALRVFILDDMRRNPRVFSGTRLPDDAQAARRAPDSSRSWKTRGGAPDWRAALGRRVPGALVVLGDLTVEALDQLTEQYTAKAHEMHAWAQLLIAYEVATIKELPEPVLREQLRKVAA